MTTTIAVASTQRRSRSPRGRVVGTVLLVTGALVVVLAWAGVGNKTVGALCNDGWESSSGGNGRCSHHDGVAEDYEVNTLVGQPAGWVGPTRWPAMAGGAALAMTGAGVLARSAIAGRRRVEPNGSDLALGAREPDATQPARSPFAGTTVELQVRLEAKPKGYAVEITTPTGARRRTLRNERLPADRGVQQLTTLMADGSRWRFGSRKSRAVESFGTDLFNALFVDAGRQAFRDSVDFVRIHDARLRVALDVEESLADIPWEYLFDPERGAFLARSPETSLVRVLRTEHVTRSVPAFEQLRVLSMAATPDSVARLDVAAEQRAIAAALEPAIRSGSVQLEFVDGGTLASLNAALDRFHPHVFHFAGHGEWDADREDGVILFEGDTGYPQRVTGVDLGTLLNRSDLRLVIFNSCDAATPSKRDRFAGVTTSLVAQGVPAAIGMQFDIDDRAAIEFGTTVLRELGRGRSIDEAVTAARIAVFAEGSHEIEWGTPVLTTRVPLDDVLPRRDN